MPTIKVKRGTKAQLDSAAGSSGLNQGELYLSTDSGLEFLHVGKSATTYFSIVKEPPKEFIFLVQNEIKVPSGDTDNIQPVLTFVPAGLKLVLERYCGDIRSGTSATLTIKQKTLAAGSFTNVATSIAVDSTENGNEGTLSSNNELSGSTSGAWFLVGIEVTAVDTAPKDMAFSIVGTYKVI